MPCRYDYVIVGSGVGGLFTGALLAAAGRRVCLLERHYALGGYGHSFRRKGYLFCAALHYIFNCLPGQDGDAFVRRLGLSDEIQFSALNANGFDRVHFPGTTYHICAGFNRNLVILSERFPACRSGLSKYFNLLNALSDDLYRLPLGSAVSDVLRHPWKFRRVVAYRRWTLKRLFDVLGFPPELRAILAAQSLDIGLPPNQASLLAHAGNAVSYDRGACVPTRGFSHLFQQVAEVIRRQPGCRLAMSTEVLRFHTEAGRIRSVRLADGEEILGEVFIFNGDPKLLDVLLKPDQLPRSFRRKLEYDYSTSFVSLHLGVKDLDLARFGFGNWNVWYYPDIDLDRCFSNQLIRHDLDQPMLFLSTPTLHATTTKAVPPNCQQLVVVTPCDYSYVKTFRDQGYEPYRAEKQRIADRMLNTIEQQFVPDLRTHIDCLSIGSPCTNRHYVLAPQGNAYGQALTPENLRLGKIDYRTPFPNLFLAGATAAIPSFGGGLHLALLLYEKLTGESIVSRQPRARVLS